MSKPSMARGVLFMTVSNLIVKAAGLMFRIPLTALIGEEGMGYYSSAYTLFTWFYMLSAAGLPTAASMMISRLPDERRRAGAMRILKVALFMFTLLGLIGCVILVLGAGLFASLMRVEQAELAIAAVAPTLFFICQSAALRGYFQGFGELRWHSISQIAEAVGKAALGVALAYLAVERGASAGEAAAWAAVGITVGVGAGMLVLYLALLLTKKARGDASLDMPALPLAKKLAMTSLPITLSSSVMSLANLIDSLIMTRSLHAIGLSQAETAAVWGNYSSLAVPMFNLPPVLTLPIAYALLPGLTEALSRHDTDAARRLTSDAMLKTTVIAMPCAIGMSAMSEPILSLLFADDVAARGAMLLTLLAPSSMLVCLLGLTNTVLQAAGHERVPLYAMLAGAAVKLASTWLLTPQLAQAATPVSTFLCYLVVMTIEVAYIAAKTPLGDAFALRHFMLPLVISTLAVTAAVIVYPMVGTLPAIAAAGILWLALCMITKILPLPLHNH